MMGGFWRGKTPPKTKKKGGFFFFFFPESGNAIFFLAKKAAPQSKEIGLVKNWGGKNAFFCLFAKNKKILKFFMKRKKCKNGGEKENFGKGGKIFKESFFGGAWGTGAPPFFLLIFFIRLGKTCPSKKALYKELFFKMF